MKKLVEKVSIKVWNGGQKVADKERGKDKKKKSTEVG